MAALEGFKEGKTRVLVATDIAARGIDISELSHVFNYDLPEVPETYVHRIGRTARAGADGTAVSFCAPEEMEYLAGIEKLNRRKIPVVSGHPWDGVPAPVKAAPPVRGRKPKAEQPAPEKAETPKAEKAAKPAAPEKKSAAKPSAAKKQKAPKIEAKEEQLMDDNKRTPGGRDNSRRNNNNRPRREGNAPAQGAGRGSNAQPKFDPHFVSAPEATPLRSAKKNAATPAVPAQTIPTAMQNRQPAQRSETILNLDREPWYHLATPEKQDTRSFPQIFYTAALQAADMMERIYYCSQSGVPYEPKGLPSFDNGSPQTLAH